MEWFQPWFWFVLALLLVGLELAVSALFFLSMASGAVLTGLLAFLIPLSFQLELIIFAVFSVLSLYGWRVMFATRAQKFPNNELNQGSKALIGATVIAAEAFANGKGRVQVGDTVWLARGPDLESGARAKVVSVDGSVLEVIPLQG